MDMEIMIIMLFIGGAILSLSIHMDFFDSEIFAGVMVILTIILIGGVIASISFLAFGKETQTVISQDEIEEISLENRNAVQVTTKDGKTIKGHLTGEINLNEKSDKQDISVVTTRKTWGCFYDEATKVVVTNK